MIAGHFEIEFENIQGENCYTLVIDNSIRHTYCAYMFDNVWDAIDRFSNIYYQGGCAQWRAGGQR